MTINVISVYPQRDAAQAAIEDLLRNGCREDDIDLLAGEEQGQEELIDEFVHRGFTEEDAEVYVSAVRHNHALVAARADDDLAEKVSKIMDRHGAMSWDELQQEAEQPEQEMQEQQSIPIVEEQLEAKKKEVTSGKRLSSEVTERQVEMQVPVREEKVEVKQENEERELSPEEAEQAFKEKEIEMKATKEVPEIEKKAKVVGQVSLEKQSSESTRKVQGTARRTEVKIEDLPEEEKRKE